MSAPSGALPVADARAVRAEVLRSLRGQGLRLLAVVVTMVVGAALGLVAPWALGRTVDTVLDDGSARDIWQLGLAMVVAAAGFAAFTALGVVLSSRLFETALARLREKMFATSVGLPLERVERSGSGDLISRATDDVDEVSSAIGTVVPALSSSLFTIAATTVGLTALDWRFLGAIVLVVPVYALAVRWYLRTAPGIYASERAAMGARAQQVLGSVRGLRTVHEYDVGPTLASRIGTHSWEVVRWSMRARIVQNRFYGRLNAAQFLSMASLLVIGYYLVGAEALTVGATTTAMLFFLRLFEPIESLLLVIDELQSALASLARIVGVIDTGADKGALTRTPTMPDSFVLEAKNVTFGYSPSRPVLSGVDIRLEPGEKVALVGASGAGKTTLAAVLAGVRSPDLGHVDFGGIDLKGVPDTERAQWITLVTQEVHVFTGTLRSDLALANPSADDADMEAALRTVLAGDWFDLLPDGLDTRIGDAGHPLTPMQAQQLALARVVLADPPVAILDEATADAGSAGASLLERSADAALEGRSALIVAHRLGQARRADRILLMDNGKIVEEGSHEALMESGGEYGQLWEAWSRHR
ncbi:ABC transporter ATP-binding protein [Rhodococcus fascians]|nr:ABC transporter ATP-binding protein [Rhodococcus fascians]MBY3999502.1 ABC transporter ATP-binding protein [Rhodococcus fascians]MBY4005035.1 ABC transporter ATP-binding protein [Rhodococcus fascians]MBY4010092.1 ABC transporter ATP-binding protein [Rhodococcus fascians]MBY4020242.1 ABC transporter ATP-binding protein [Rhodococcus fascians]